jgi:hypothetical protein
MSLIADCSHSSVRQRWRTTLAGQLDAGGAAFRDSGDGTSIDDPASPPAAVIGLR